MRPFGARLLRCEAARGGQKGEGGGGGGGRAGTAGRGGMGTEVGRMWE